MKATPALLTAGLLVAGLLGAARSSDGAIVASLAGDRVAGKATFTQYCSICHGVTGAGFIGPRIAGINWTADGLQSIVRHGVGGYGGMPAFNAAVVTDKNIADIAAFLATAVSPAALPSASPSPPPAPAPTASSQTADLVHGRAVYSANCAACHGATAEGGFGPSLRGEKNRKDIAAATQWIKNPKLPMPKLYPDPLSAKDVDDVAAYIESL